MPDIKSHNLAESRVFYVDFLGMELAMDMGFVMTFVSPSNPTAQLTLLQAGAALEGGKALLELCDAHVGCAVRHAGGGAGST